MKYPLHRDIRRDVARVMCAMTATKAPKRRQEAAPLANDNG